MTKYNTPASISPEAVQKLQLMPYKVKESMYDVELEVQEPVPLKWCRTKRGTVTKYTFTGYYFKGSGGVQGAIDHVLFMKNQIRYFSAKVDNMKMTEKIDCFMVSLSGLALSHGMEAYNEMMADIMAEESDSDEDEEDDEEIDDKVSFEDYLKAFVAKFGTTMDRQYQLDGLHHVRKPRNCPVITWKTVFHSLNEAVDYCSGTGVKNTGREFIQRYFNTFSQAWRDAYHSNATYNLETATVDSITIYMLTRENNAHVKTAQNEANNQSYNKSNGNNKSNKKRGYDKTRGEGEAPGGRQNRNKKFKSNRLDKRTIEMRKNARGPGKCWFCPDSVALHDYKDCPNKKGKNKPDNGSHTMTVDTSGNTPTAGGFKPTTATKQPGMYPVTSSPLVAKTTHMSNTIETTHHLDCFTIQDLNQGITTPSSSASPRPNELHGSHCETCTLKMSPPGGFVTKSKDATWSKVQAEHHCMLATCFAIGNALYDENNTDVVSFDSNNTYKMEFENAIKFADDIVPIERISQHEIVEGAMTPSTIVTIRTIGGITFKKPLRALIDSGSCKSFIYQSALPKGSKTTQVKGIKTTLLDRSTTIDTCVQVEDIVLPEFSTSMHITTNFELFVAKTEAKHFDLILGQDFNTQVGIDVINSRRMMTWLGNEVPLRALDFQNQQQINSLFIDAFSPQDNDFETSCMLANIKPAEYKKANVEEVAQAQKHLTPKQRNELQELLKQFPKLFSGELGKYPHRKIHLDIDPAAKPVRRRPYPVAHAHLNLFKGELDRLCEIGVLKKAGASEWSLPTFIIPKKDGTIRWVSDLRELNKVIKRKAYPLPRISDVLRRRSGYKYFTKLDISMQYYTFELDDESKEICTISTPFGNYQYQRMPMGCCQSSDYAQEIMESILADIAAIECYIDDVGVFSDTWKKHLYILDEVLSRLQANNFTINPLKCEWGVQETDFLGHWMTPTGIKPWRKK